MSDHVVSLSGLNFNRQFLLTRQACAVLAWEPRTIGGYYLYTHPNLEVSIFSSRANTYILLGYLFDHRKPEYTNADILKELSRRDHFESMMTELDEMSGRFILLWMQGSDLFVIPDACGQREVFYNTYFTAFGSQPKILEQVIVGEDVVQQEAIDFFQSPSFDRARIFVSDRTHRKNIFRLQPNHYIDVHRRTIHRYFPSAPVKIRDSAEVAERAVTMLKGYLQAASRRYSLEVGVTAGYDSRVLFLASLDLPVIPYVGRNKEANTQTDVKIALQLGSAHGKQIEIKEMVTSAVTEEAKLVQDCSVDFPRYRSIKGNQSLKMIVNGNVSEIARSYFGNERNLSGAELARMCGFGDSPYVTHLYSEWLQQNKPLFDQLGYHYLDLFYWEERMGNWSAKGKTEAGFSVEVYSPFNSRALLQLLLSTDRRDRDKQFNRLYDTIIGLMSPAALKIPINPMKKVNTIRLLKRLGVYDLYRKYGIRWGILKH